MTKNEKNERIFTIFETFFFVTYFEKRWYRNFLEVYICFYLFLPITAMTISYKILIKLINLDVPLNKKPSWNSRFNFSILYLKLLRI